VPGSSGCAGRSAWCLSPEEIVVFKSVGVGLSDQAAAALEWERLGGRIGLKRFAWPLERPVAVSACRTPGRPC